MTYFILINNQQQGPYTLDELRSRNITSATLVWTEGMADWTPAWQVAELQTLFRNGSTDSAATPPPHAPEPQAGDSAASASSSSSFAADSAAATASRDAFRQSGQQTAERQFMEQPQPSEQEEAERRRHGHGLRNGCVVLLVALAAVLVGLVATCPTADDHREAITKEINRVVEHASQRSGGGDAWGMIGSMITKNIVGVVVDNMIDVDNYGVCSVGSITFKGKKKQVSFGILGHVFTFDADDIERALSKGGDNGDFFSSPLNNPGGDDSGQQDDDQSSDDGSSVGNGDDNSQSPSDDGSDGSADNNGQDSQDGADDGTVDF